VSWLSEGVLAEETLVPIGSWSVAGPAVELLPGLSLVICDASVTWDESTRVMIFEMAQAFRERHGEGQLKVDAEANVTPRVVGSERVRCVGPNVMTVLVGLAALVGYRPVVDAFVVGQAAMQRLTKRVSQAGDLNAPDGGGAFTYCGTAPSEGEAFIEPDDEGF
jgi:hypothetical protein